MSELADSILSLTERLDAHPDYAGRGVGIGFVDSAFVPHPDLVRPTNRVLYFSDVTRAESSDESFLETDAHVWHGTMIACCAAGNGYLSQGRYRGLAHEATLALVQVKPDATRPILGRAVARALRRLLDRRAALGIRIVNVSVGVDWSDPDAEDVERAVGELVAAGIVVVAAAGNSEGAAPTPPASAAAAITVGGIDDHNTQRTSDDARWPSSAGARSGRAPKPDLLAPANRLAAPMVTGTLTAREGPLLFQLLRVLEETESDVIFRKRRALDAADRADGSVLRILHAVQARIQEQKLIAPSYQHVDGTSFAAPIVASIVAQMLEANPSLDPAAVREGLLGTCRPLPDVPAWLQGAGVVQPRRAVEWAVAQRRSSRASVPPTSRG